MTVKRFVDDILILAPDELAKSLVSHFNIRFRPSVEVPSVIHGVKLEEILEEIFRRKGFGEVE